MRSLSTIDLVKTSNGYSIIQNQSLINKSTSVINPLKNKQKGVGQVPKKLMAQQSFTIYPYIQSQGTNHPYLILPTHSQWFNLTSIHQIQRKSLPEWFKIKKGVSATMNHGKFQKNQQLYLKYRNYIVQLAKDKYVTPLIARKGLAGDVQAIIRIHRFLQQWSIINFVHQKAPNTSNLTLKKADIKPIAKQTVKRKDCFDKDKLNINKLYDKDDLQLLKKITKKFRPVCGACQGICGIVWYQYRQTIQQKKIITNQQKKVKNIESGSTSQYLLRVCFNCYSTKNIPVVLSYDDFAKKTIIQSIQQISNNKFNKQTNQQVVKIVQAVEKTRFNIRKSAEILEIQQKQLFNVLMRISLKHLQRISRIQPDTQDQQIKITNFINKQTQQAKICPPKKQISQASLQTEQTNDLQIFQRNIANLKIEQQKIYQQFLQSWLLKIYAKVQNLSDWDHAIRWKLTQNQSIQKYNIAEKLQKNIQN